MRHGSVPGTLPPEAGGGPGVRSGPCRPAGPAASGPPAPAAVEPDGAPGDRSATGPEAGPAAGLRTGGRFAVLNAGLPTAVRDSRLAAGGEALRRGWARGADCDRRLLVAARRRAGTPAVALAARGLSWAGEHGAVWIAAGLAGACTDPARRGAWLRATALVAGSHAASIAAKRAVRRPRPPLVAGGRPLVRTAGRHGFPSSHAASSAAAAIAFGALLRPGPLTPAAGPDRAAWGAWFEPLAGSGCGPAAGLRPVRLLPATEPGRGPAGAALAGGPAPFAGLGPARGLAPAVRVLAAAVCLSRLVAGVHYPTDVACGALLGATLARLGRHWSLAGVLP